jgi:hypothetical protein
MGLPSEGRGHKFESCRARLCWFFADRAQEGDKQTGLGRTW